MDSDRQLPLFATGELKSSTRFSARGENVLQMDNEYLQRWKDKIVKHQQQMRCSQPLAQGTLFDLASPATDSETIDPFALTLHSFSFFRLPTEGAGCACLYFVLDTAAPLLLYIGETCRSNKRWKGQHQAKSYLHNYQSLHYKYGLKPAICMAFWWDVPVKTRPRQEIESALIAKWKPPFNKQNWSAWGAPFV